MTALFVALVLAQTTPNMDLPLTTPGVTTVTQLQNDFNQAMNTIDSHTHASGSGVQIPVPGIDILASLPFNGNAETNVYWVGFSDGGAGPSVPLGLYSNGIDLCYEDGNGNKFCLTCNGGLCVGPGDGGPVNGTTCNFTTSCKIDGETIANNCTTFSNGASVCGDTGPGDVIVTAVDAGGTLYVKQGSTTEFEVTASETYSANEVVGDGFYSNAGSSIVAGYDACFDTGCSSYITESGQNTVLNLLDGGGLVLTEGNKSGNFITCLFDGGSSGVPAFNVGYSGITTCGQYNSAEAIRFTSNPHGVGVVTISSLGNTDPDIGIAVIPQGDGGVILEGHIDTANSQNSTTVAFLDGGVNGAPPCFGPNATMTLSSGASDTAGTITILAGDGGTGWCDFQVIAEITFANAYANTANNYALMVSPQSAYAALQPNLSTFKLSTGFALYTTCLAESSPGICNTGSSLNQQISPNQTYSWDYVTIGQGANSH